MQAGDGSKPPKGEGRIEGHIVRGGMVGGVGGHEVLSPHTGFSGVC